MVALQEEEERFRQMQQCQEAATVNSSLSDASSPSTPHESLSETASPILRKQGVLTPILSSWHSESRESDLSRRSQEVANSIDKVVETYNASFRTTPEIIKSMTSVSKLPALESDTALDIQENQTLQMV